MGEREIAARANGQRPLWLRPRVLLGGAFALALTPMVFGVWMIWSTGEYSASAVALIAFGPGVVVGLFAAVAWALEQRSFRQQFERDREDP